MLRQTYRSGHMNHAHLHLHLHTHTHTHRHARVVRVGSVSRVGRTRARSRYSARAAESDETPEAPLGLLLEVDHLRALGRDAGLQHPLGEPVLRSHVVVLVPGGAVLLVLRRWLHAPQTRRIQRSRRS